MLGGNNSDYEEVEPMIEGYQLIGDSQFLRFAEQLLHSPRRNKDGLAYLGLCVSGQTTCDLLKRIKTNFHPVTSRVVLMIGTNDIMKNTNLSILKKYYTDLLVELLRRGVERLIILTVPPVPRLAKSENHWILVKELNDHIRSNNNRKEVVVIDSYKKFIRKNDLSKSLSSRNSLSSSRSSLVSNSSGISSQSPRSSINCLNFPSEIKTSNYKIKTNLRISIGEDQERVIYKTEHDSEEEEEDNNNDAGYGSEQPTPKKRSSSFQFSTPNPKRRSFGSSLSFADDDHDDRFSENDCNDEDYEKIRTEYFEQFFAGRRHREDNIHLNNKGLRLIRRLILDEIQE